MQNSVQLSHSVVLIALFETTDDMGPFSIEQNRTSQTDVAYKSE